MVRAAFHFLMRRRKAGFWRANDGAMAVEFAFVGVPFIALLIGILEIGMIFMVSISLENATSTAARRIRTGELSAVAAGAEAASLSAFKAEVCDNMGWLASDCASSLSVDVRTFTSFSAVTLPNPVVGGVFNPGTLGFKPGPACSIVLVRAWYEWPLISPLMHQGLVRMPGKTLVTSAATFRSEPYGAAPC